MIAANLRIALRVLIREKGYTILQVLGLSIGLATALILGAYVFEDFRIDSFINDQNSIARMSQTLTFPGTDPQMIGNTAGNYTTTIVDHFPEVEYACRLTRRRGDFRVRKGDGVIEESEGLYVDNTFFKMFSYPVLEGDPLTAFNDPAAIAISRKVAEEYFPEGKALGKRFEIEGGESKVVTAVFDIPKPGSFFEPRFLMPLEFADINSEHPNDHRYAAFFKLTPGTDLETLADNANELIFEGVTPRTSTLSFQWFKDIHLHSSHINNQINYHPADLNVVIASGTVALFILLIAMINTINLATARATRRAREVGLRKVVGKLFA